MLMFIGIACILAGYIVLDKPSTWAWQNNFRMYKRFAIIGWGLTAIGLLMVIVGAVVR